jgi:hypothetical protein
MAMAVRVQVQRAKAHLGGMQGLLYCISSVLQDGDFMAEVLAFYR